MNRHELVHVRSHSNLEVWADPNTRRVYLAKRSANGEVQFNPIEYHQSTPEPRLDCNLDPIALLGIGAASALLIGGVAWWIGYGAGSNRAIPPAQKVVTCQTTRESSWFQTVEKTNCK